MKLPSFLVIRRLIPLLLFTPCVRAAAPAAGPPPPVAACEPVADGIWRIRLGKPENLTPTRFRSGAIQTQSLKQLGGPKESPILPGDIHYQVTARGCAVTLPMNANERTYGLGLSARGFDKTNTRQKLIPSDNPEVDGGPSHAPVPFYVSTAGYGVLVAIRFQYAARDFADATSPPTQVLRVSVGSGSAPLVTKDLVGSTAGFASATLGFTAADSHATLVFANASGAGESCVTVAAVSITPAK